MKPDRMILLGKILLSKAASVLWRKKSIASTRDAVADVARLQVVASRFFKFCRGTSGAKLLCRGVLLSAGISLFTAGAFGQALDSGDTRLNDIQVVGTHNSYHVAAQPEVLTFIEGMKPEWRQALDYTHLPLDQQLGLQGVRQFELDLFADPKGGLYANPMVAEVVQARGIKVANHDPKGQLTKPGIKVLHHQDFDFRTNHLTLIDALTAVKQWSVKNPKHEPIFILLELKDRQLGRITVKPVPWDAEQLKNLEKEIRSVFNSQSIITPDKVRGESKTLRQAVLNRGWPTLDDCRGKVLFALDNGDPVRKDYLALRPGLKQALLFVDVGEKHPAAAFLKINDPVKGFKRIQRLVKAGFLVRTRADADTIDARNNDTKRRDKAMASGAQMISTDFPVAVPAISTYSVQLPGNVPYRPNPVRTIAEP